LYQRLAGLVRSGHRSTAALADAGILTAGTCFFGDPLDFTGLPPGSAGRAARQARRRLTDLTRGVPVQPVAAVRFSRGSNRLFLIGAASATHFHYLTGRLTALQHGPWAGELTVYWPD
jgi:hypothetical protein